MQRSVKNQSELKIENRLLVLKLICTGQCDSRAEISRKTGLSKMTVTNIIQELLRDGLICEGQSASKNTVGRKAISLYPNEASKKSVGVYIARDGITVSLLSLNAKILQELAIPIGPGDTSGTLAEKVLSGVNDILSMQDRRDILGIGLSCIGPLDIQNGILLSPPDFYGIENAALKKPLEEATSLPVVVDNDMNAAALAELLYGNGVGVDHFLYFGITHGVGAGIVANGRLYTGAGGYGGEIGHVCIRDDGPLCSCGNRGCLEVYASMPVFLEKVRQAAEKAGNSWSSDVLKPTFSDVIARAKEGDAFALTQVDGLCNAVCTGLVSAIHLLNSSAVFIGHESAQGGEWLAAKIEEQINRRSLFQKNSAVRVRISAFGERSSVAGSGVLVFDRFFQGLL